MDEEIAVPVGTVSLEVDVEGPGVNSEVDTGATVSMENVPIMGEVVGIDGPALSEPAVISVVEITEGVNVESDETEAVFAVVDVIVSLVGTDPV